MSVNAQSGEFSFGLQPGKVGARGTFDSSLIDYYKMRVTQVSAGAVQDQQDFPPEVGGLPVPSGAFKQALFSVAQATFIPRAKEIFGVLLVALLGDVSTATGVNSAGDSVTGLNTHNFKFNANPSHIPWMSARILVPGATTIENSGESGFDMKVATLRLMVPGKGKLGCQIGLVGRDLEFSDAASWSYINSVYENDLSTPDAGKGEFKIGGIEYPIVGATFDFINSLTTPDEEAIIGSYNPDDFMTKYRPVSVSVVYKYENDDLCRMIYTGAPDDAIWDELPFYTELSGSEHAFEAYFQAPGNIDGLTAPYGIRIRAARATWQKGGPIQLAGNNIIYIPINGTILLPASGEYIEVLLENESDGALYIEPEVFTLDMGAALSYSTGDTVLDSTVTLTYNGMSVWNGGKVGVAWGLPSAGALSANDSFSISTAGNFSIASNVLSHSATPVGIIAGGTYGENLSIVLNANATTAIVEELLEALRYGRVAGSDSTTVFNATVVIQDDAGNTATHVVAITHV